MGKELVYDIVPTNMAEHAGEAVGDEVTQKEVELGYYFALKGAQAILFLALKGGGESQEPVAMFFGLNMVPAQGFGGEHALPLGVGQPVARDKACPGR